MIFRSKDVTHFELSSQILLEACNCTRQKLRRSQNAMRGKLIVELVRMLKTILRYEIDKGELPMFRVVP